ncbi:FkbM family methyltransferase [Rhodocytophaga aerolata]|uniref:FkbM family methyltransferase n=1 Tax=Rhodocytophaga aerolata TaxID=455078 RepID=A0ABT8RA86_9BACT|nr:FkbM family methyltransferase [Rhodocytophaga aerolata]MDO1449011.1 FkbM family methyltransferase [Rhodocytophaga aerolata]
MHIPWLNKKLNHLLYQKAYSRAIFTTFGLVIKEMQQSFRQFFTWHSPLFSLLRSIKYMLIPLLRLVQGRNVRISYGFTGEDRLIESLLKTQITYNGFYVDVGCNHPQFLSNSFLFYRRGWRGICIDANSTLIQLHKRVRPWDKAVCALVSDLPEVRTFYELTNNVLSTTEPQFLEEYLSEGLQVMATRSIVPQTLTSILDACQAPAHIDFLSIDAEEHDLHVLQSLDFRKYSPTLIIVEDESFDPATPSQNTIFTFLQQREYSLAGSILKNVYYLKNKQ